MRDMRDVGGTRAKNVWGICLKSLVTLLTLLTLTAPAPAADGKSVSTIEFADNASVQDYLNIYGILVGKTVLVDPKVPKANFGLHPQKDQKLSNEDKIEAIETVLEMNGIHLEPFGEKFVRALPRKDARKEGIPLYLDEKALEADVEAGKVPEGKVISYMVRFRFLGDEDIEQVASKVLESFKSDASGAPLVLKNGRRILVTDTYVNIKRMLEILPEIDVEAPAEPLPEVECIQIKNASAADIHQVIKDIVEDSKRWEEQEAKKNGSAKGGQASAARPNGGKKNILVPNADPKTQPAISQAALVIDASEAAHGIIKGRVTAIAEPKSNKIILITKSENMQLFKKIIEALDVKTTLDTDVRVYRLKYADAEDVSDMFNDLIGNSSSSKDSKGNQNQNAKTGTNANLTRNTQNVAKAPANRRTGEPSAGELNKDNTTVLADKRINGLVVMSTKELFPTIEQIIESMDIKLSQVLIETVIIEVGLGDDLSTGIDWVNNNWTGKDPSVMGGGGGGGNSGTLSAITDGGKTWAEYLKDAQTIIGDVGDSQYGGSTYSDKQTAIEKMAKSLQEAAAKEITVKPVGTGLNYYLKSDKLNISAVITASKTDSHSKYIASPVIMTLDNKEAEIKATEMRYLFKGYTYSGSTYNGSAVPDYEQKELGITIKTTPKINPNGTVMLTIEEEYSQEGSGQAITAANGTDKISAATTITRKMSADALLENGQTVVFGGLTETKTGEKTGGIPILKDIPIIGKWLFGYVEESEARKELLVFMTPYVLDDAQAAQAEALRRKKAISDSRPWDDHGWSASELADPVSKQEQMRRIKDLWRVQDEERRTRIAIEKEKVNRVKKLQEMSKDEREMWLKMHKAELDAEAQDELEEKMLDEKSQEGLKKLAEQVKAKKLGEAEKAIKQAEDEAAAENERGKLDAAKKVEKADKAEVLSLIDQLGEETKAK